MFVDINGAPNSTGVMQRQGHLWPLIGSGHQGKISGFHLIDLFDILMQVLYLMI